MARISDLIVNRRIGKNDICFRVEFNARMMYLIYEDIGNKGSRVINI